MTVRFIILLKMVLIIILKSALTVMSKKKIKVAVINCYSFYFQGVRFQSLASEDEDEAEILSLLLHFLVYCPLILKEIQLNNGKASLHVLFSLNICYPWFDVLETSANMFHLIVKLF